MRPETLRENRNQYIPMSMSLRLWMTMRICLKGVRIQLVLNIDRIISNENHLKTIGNPIVSNENLQKPKENLYFATETFKKQGKINSF